MSGLKIFFFLINHEGLVESTVHRGLNTVHALWKGSDPDIYVGLMHIGFVRPSLADTNGLFKYKGKVLVSASTKWALPSAYVTSKLQVASIRISEVEVPCYMLLQGWGYNFDEKEPGNPNLEDTSYFEKGRMSIAEAANEILKQERKPLSDEVIFARIVEQGLHSFAQKMPVSYMTNELLRYTADEKKERVDGCLFGKTDRGLYFSLDNTKHELNGWLLKLSEINESISKKLAAYGIHDQESFEQSFQMLPSELAQEADIYRYRIERHGVDCLDLKSLVKILPHSLMLSDLEELGLSVRTINVFRQNSIENLMDLKGISMSEVMGWLNFGKKSAQDTCSVLIEKADELVDLLNEDHSKDRVNYIDEAIHFSESNRSVDSREGLVAKISLKGSLEKTLSKLNDVDRQIILARTGANGERETLQEVAEKVGVTRERIRQRQNKFVSKIINEEYWDDVIAIRIGQLLLDRKSPLYLETLEIEDNWFEGFMDNYAHLAGVIEMFSENQIRIIKINGANIITRIKQDDWDGRIVPDMRDAIKLKADEGGWSRKDIDYMFQATLSDYGTPELKQLLWDEFSESIHFESDALESKLISYGKTAESAILAVLNSAEKPLHYNEVSERATEILGKNVDPRRAHAACQSLGAHLYGRGIYGFSRFNPLSKRESENILSTVEHFIYSGPLTKQWHNSELLNLLKGKFPALSEKLDIYVLNIILSKSGKLNYLNRMVWARTDSGQTVNDRVDMADAFTKILEDIGRPLKGEELKKRLANIRGVPDSLQIQPTDRMILVGPDLWGLIDRDVGGSEEDNSRRLDALYKHLTSTEAGVHVSEVEGILESEGFDDRDAPSSYTLFNLAQRDNRFYLGRAMYLGLAQWGEDTRRINLSQAVRQVVENMTSPMSIVDINRKVEGLTGLPVDNTVANQLKSIGVIYNPDKKVWATDKKNCD